MRERLLRAALRSLIALAWAGIVALVVLAVVRLTRISGALASIPSLEDNAADLRAAAAELDRSWATLVDAGDIRPAHHDRLQRASDQRDGGRARPFYTRAEYEDEMARDLAKCEPEAMLRYEETVPAWVYLNPIVRSAVAKALRGGEYGPRWMRAASASVGAREGDGGEASAADEIQDRLVRMGSACVSIFFHGPPLYVRKVGDRYFPDLPPGWPPDFEREDPTRDPVLP